MRFIVDECTGPAIAQWLRDQGHDVFSVYDQARGMDDDGVLKIAIAERRILVTNDKDFGRMVFHEGKAHAGIVLLRLEDERAGGKIKVLARLLDRHADRLAGNLFVVTEKAVRIVPVNS